MKLRWVGVGSLASVVLVVTIMSMASASTAINPAMGGYLSIQPKWNSGNLCTSLVTNPVAKTVTCTSTYSADPTPLWYNFSAGEVTGVTFTVYVYGSADCINMNFHSFYSAIVINLIGSEFACGGAPGLTPGVNIVVNSEGDTVQVNEIGSSYATNLTSYGATVAPSVFEDGSSLNTTVTYVGWSEETQTCPSGIVDGRVSWSVTQIGSYNTFSTIFVDGTNVVHAPPNYAYSTEPMTPLDGTAFGIGNLYGNETTQTAPAGACYYLGV